MHSKTAFTSYLEYGLDESFDINHSSLSIQKVIEPTTRLLKSFRGLDFETFCVVVELSSTLKP